MYEQERNVVDALVVCDGYNPSFYAYIPQRVVEEILEEGGLACASSLILRETEDRPVPEYVQNGQAEITDVLIKLEPNVCFNLN